MATIIDFEAGQARRAIRGAQARGDVSAAMQWTLHRICTLTRGADRRTLTDRLDVIIEARFDDAPGMFADLAALLAQVESAHAEARRSA